MNLMSWPLSVPVLTDGFVTLRAHHNNDLEPMVEMVTDPQTQTWTSVPAEYHEQAAEQFMTDVVSAGWDSGSHRIWVVELEGAFVGQVDLRGAGAVKEIAYVTHPFFRERGATRAAVRLVLNYAFTELETEVVHWRARVGNVASLRVAHACGFTFHETIPRLLHEHGQLHDAWTGSIAFGEPTFPRDEWPSIKLAGERVRLRPLRTRDAQRWDETLGEESAQTYLVGTTGAFTEGDAAQRLANVSWDVARGRSYAWVITDLESDEFCGLVIAHGLKAPNAGGTEFEWMLHPEARGRGFMTEAVTLALNYVLDPDGFDQRRATAFVAASNIASNRVAERAGGRLFGTQTSSEPIGSGDYDNLNEYEWLR